LANAFISQVSTQVMLIKSITHNSIAMFSLKPYTLAGFEPGSSVPEADAMSRAARALTSFFQFFKHYFDKDCF
jgi:hypothetical protein